jgi:hypothetical protein
LKISEILDFINQSPQNVLCSDCEREAAAEARRRHDHLTERMEREVGLRPTFVQPEQDVENPANYNEEKSHFQKSKSSLRTKSQKRASMYGQRRTVSNNETSYKYLRDFYGVDK